MKLDKVLVVSSIPSKWTLKYHFFNFNLHMKHDNVIKYDPFIWNWSKSTLCDDTSFITSCINNAFGNEIQWPTIEERVSLGTHFMSFLVALGLLMTL